MSKKQQRQKRPQEYKTLPFIPLKFDDDQGVVEHIITVFGILDAGGDISHPGSFSKTITERGHKALVLDMHNTDSIMRALGTPLALREIGRDELPQQILDEYPEATGGVWARTQFLMDTPEGKGAYIRLKEKAVREWSYGYDSLDEDFSTIKRDGQDITVRNLRTVKLYEYGPCLWGMNPATATTSAKSKGSEPSETKPWDVFPRGDEFCVYLLDDDGEQTGESLGCHATEAEARAQVEALYANVEEASEEEDKTVSGNTNLPIASREHAWDGSAARKRMQSWAGAGDEPNAKYRQGFFWYDGENADNFGAYKLPFADTISGKLTAIPAGVFACGAALRGARGGVEIPAGQVAGVKAKVARYYARMREQFDDDAIVVPWEKAITWEDVDAKMREYYAEAKVTDPSADDVKTATLYAFMTLAEKAGRVLAARNVSRIEGALSTLIEVLEDAGLSLQGWERQPQIEEIEEEGKTQKEWTEQGPMQRLGDVLQGNIHKIFTLLCDNWVIEGMLDRDERIQLSSLIGDALGILATGIPEEVAQRPIRYFGPERLMTVADDGQREEQAVTATKAGPTEESPTSSEIAIHLIELDMLEVEDGLQRETGGSS